MFGSKLILLLLVAIVPSHCSDEPLQDQLDELLAQLQNATDEYHCIFDVSGNQCPCLTSDHLCLLGNETINDVDCFENKLHVLSNILHDLIDDLTNLTSDRPADCPILVGCAALVASCDTNVIAVADGAETILPNLVVSENVSGLTVSDDEDCYTLYYFTEDPVDLHAVETNGDTTALSIASTRATGIAYCDGAVFLATEGSIISVNTTTYDETDIVSLTGEPGVVRVYGGRVYFSDGNEIKSTNKTGGDLQEELKFPMGVSSFDVLDEERLVFGDSAGGLWVYNKTSECFKLLDCRSGSVDVKVNPCFDQFYVVYPGDTSLSRWNSTTCEQDEPLTYTLSSAASCPRLAFEPNCARPTDRNLFP